MMSRSPCLPRPAQIYNEGMHIKLPWFERQVIYDVRARPSLIQSSSGSRDLQTVSTRDTPSRHERCVTRRGADAPAPRRRR